MPVFTQAMLSWPVRKRFWDRWSIMRFAASQTGTIPLPGQKERDINAVPLNSILPDIPIENILVADHIPADEQSPLSRLLFQLQSILNLSPLSPMQPDLKFIDDPQTALDQAYTSEHQRYFAKPRRPDQYQKGNHQPDLGTLAVTGPYAGYLKISKGGESYEWDLRELGEYQHHPGLYSLDVRVLFRVNGDRLVATQIENKELGMIKPDNEQWDLAQKIALCAVSTHTSLVRHFNWVHLACGGPLAIAARNQLPAEHPLMRLLWPHIYGTQISNQNVTQDQMGPGGKFDTIFSFTHQGMCQLFSRTYDQYSISVIDPQLDASKRGIDKAAFARPSQNNLEQLFEVIHIHSKHYLRKYYATDEAVRNDHHIRQWLYQLDQLIPNGIGELISADTVNFESLSRFCASLIYLVTVQHEALGTALWNYQLWIDKQPVRVYKNHPTERVDVYQRLVNANFDLNVKRISLLDDFTHLALDQKGREAFRAFKQDLLDLQEKMEAEDKQEGKESACWKIRPDSLEANMNANVLSASDNNKHRQSQLLDYAYRLIEDWPWHQLPPPLGLVSLKGIRETMRKRNLYDSTPAPEQAKINHRTAKGDNNHWGCPHMGAANTAFGRNFAPEYVKLDPDKNKLMSPNPREISRRLLKREENKFLPVKQLNLLTAAWIQFQVHDWFAHDMHKQEDNDRLKIPIAEDDDWPGDPIQVRRTKQLSENADPPVYINVNTHWWDCSQVYGSDDERAEALRTDADGKRCPDGKLALDEKTGLLPQVDDEVASGFTDNWWIGLSMLHVLFAAEHNRICDVLKKRSLEYAQYAAHCDEQKTLSADESAKQKSDWLYQKARLINTALIAKIHTLEWTTAILNHKTVVLGMQANWDGIDKKEFQIELDKMIVQFSEHYNLSPQLLQQLQHIVANSGLTEGILGSHTDHHGVPYAMTEEFVSVYRMHPLLPDHINLRSPFGKTGNDSHYGLLDVSLKNTRGVMKKFELADLFFSFGTAHPGLLKLHNYPESLRRLQTEKDGVIDLAAIDILRDRERNVPRYNQFRQLLGKKPVETFEELTGEKPTSGKSDANTLKDIYADKINDVDLMVGLFAEPPVEGLGFSETAFRVFLLMASRRIQSDRFFTSDFNAETYTALGLEWIRNNTMVDVLKRHYPDLEPNLEGLDNAFKPWRDHTSLEK